MFAVLLLFSPSVIVLLPFTFAVAGATVLPSVWCRLLFFPFRSFFPVAPGGAGSARVPLFLTTNGVRLVLDGIVYGYVLLGGACCVDCVLSLLYCV